MTLIKNALFCLASLLLNIGFSQTKTVSYTADQGLFANPETGPVYSNSHTGTQSFMPPLSNSNSVLTNYRANYGFSTVFYSYYIGEYKRTVLPQSVLDRIDADMATARQLGYKVMPHFHYAFAYTYAAEKFVPPYIWKENEIDAKRDIIIRHIAQLKPILAKNADVIALMAWGLIGPWGEMWISSNFNVGDSTVACCDRIGDANNNTRAIIKAELDATPSDRMITFVPVAKRQLYGATPLEEREAFTGTEKSRIGIVNQCFLTDQNAGDPTYINNDYRGPRAYLQKEGLYVPQLAFPDVGGCGYKPTPAQLIDEMNAGHWDFITGTDVSRNIFQTNLDDIAVQNFFKQIGYRFQLKSLTVPSIVEVGKSFNVQIQIANLNGGALFNPRAIELILRNVTTKQKYVFNIKGDSVQNRLYFPKPKSETTWAWTLNAPGNAIPGTYEVLLNLPDPYPSIHDRPEYSIRLANKDTWEASTGYNKLLTNVTISSAITSIDETNVLNNLDIYPNPAKNELNISGIAPQSGEYEITSIDGRVLQQGTMETNSILLYNLASGIYIIKVKTEGGQIVKHFTKE